MAFSRFTLDASALDDQTVGLDGANFPLNGLGSAQLGGVAAQADAANIVSGTAASELGGIVGASSATVAVVGQASGDLGGLSASAAAQIGRFASAAAHLGAATASASAAVVITASGATLVPGTQIVALGTVVPSGEGIMSAPLGGLSASASAIVTPAAKPVGTGGTRRRLPQNFVQAQPAPKTTIQPVDTPTVSEAEEPEREPSTVVALAYSRLPVIRARAVAMITFVSEDDDAEVLALV